MCEILVVCYKMDRRLYSPNGTRFVPHFGYSCKTVAEKLTIPNILLNRFERKIYKCYCHSRTDSTYKAHITVSTY